MIATQRAARALPYQRIGAALTISTRQASTASCHLRSLQAVQHQLAGQDSLLMNSSHASTAKHTFSTHVSQTNDIADKPVRNLGTVTRSLEQLDTSVVKMIEAELREVDTNKDGRCVRCYYFYWCH
jgi:hypothetical protein